MCPRLPLVAENQDMRLFSLRHGALESIITNLANATTAGFKREVYVTKPMGQMQSSASLLSNGVAQTTGGGSQSRCRGGDLT